jgi:hypothetical protein
VPEAARLLRPGGLLAFTHVGPIYDIAFAPDAEPRRRPLGQRLLRAVPAAGRGRDGRVQPALRGPGSGCSATAAWWSRTYSSPGPGPDATSTYRDAEDLPGRGAGRPRSSGGSASPEPGPATTGAVAGPGGAARREQPERPSPERRRHRLPARPLLASIRGDRTGRGHGRAAWWRPTS